MRQVCCLVMEKTCIVELYGKEPYEAPAIIIVEVKSEGVICTSGEGRGIWEEDD